MLVALTKEDKLKKVAKYATKEEGPFICPCCSGEVVLRKNYADLLFFAHKNTGDCVFGEREKEIQRHAKITLYDTLCAKGIDSEIEYMLNGAHSKPYIVDVMVSLPQGMVAVMFNGHTLTSAEIRQHIQVCHTFGIGVFWGAIMKGTENKARYLPTAFEKFIHAYQQGTIYYWSGGDMFKACQYEPYVPMNKLLERNYGKYVVRQFHPEPCSLTQVTFSPSTYRSLPDMPMAQLPVIKI